MNLYIYSYNNYYNRLVKKAGDRIVDYTKYLLYGPVQGVYGFTPGDGVNTTQVIGTNAMMYDGKGDYLIAHDPQTNKIDSRWFIVENTRTRDGQWQLTLHRDLIVDFYNDIINSPMYVEKATLNDNDSAIWNNEGVSVNQIKTNEYALQDDSRCAWICGYIARDYAGGTLELTAEVRPDIEVSSLSNWEYYAYYDEGGGRTIRKLVPNSLKIYFDYNVTPTRDENIYQPFKRVFITQGQNSWSEEKISSSSYTGSYKIGEYLVNLPSNPLRMVNTLIPSSDNNLLLQLATSYLSSYENDPFNDVKNKYIKDLSTGKVYKILIEKYNTSTQSYNNMGDKFYINGTPSVATYIKNKLYYNNTGNEYSQATGTPSINISCTFDYMGIYLEETTLGTYRVTLPNAQNRYNLSDAPYDMFCIPYNKEKPLSINYGQGSLTIPSGIISMSVAQEIARAIGKGNIYDLQLLPFCPLQGYDYDGNVLTFSNVTSKFYTVVSLDGSDTNKTIMFWASTSLNEISGDRLHLINTQNQEELRLPLRLENKKISNECDMYRLCSPNYNGLFEFNASKLNGITGFNVDYTYLPYSPYLHVNPIFSGLYGKDFDDARGLICQGDFSISYLSDAWENYQVQNKNYANIFNRQIENMELKQGIERKQQIFNAVTGTIMGGTAGAVAGSKGGIAGAIAGGIVGTVAGGIGGALDVQYGDILRNEALDYTKDMFNYQLENIQALPDSIAKVTAYTKNNKIFPILEYYTCTDIEKEAIANKIAWNGMTVMRIDTMGKFINNDWSYNGIESKGYIKGQLIRPEGIEENYKIINSIAGELIKGVYIK